MGAAAIRHLKTMVMCGYEARDALATAVGSIALDCLRSVMPASEYEGRQSYLVARVSCVLNALDGEGWSLLTDREVDVALCVRSLLRDPEAWDPDEWESRLSQAVEPYRVAAGIAGVASVA